MICNSEFQFDCPSNYRDLSVLVNEGGKLEDNRYQLGYFLDTDIDPWFLSFHESHSSASYSRHSNSSSSKANCSSSSKGVNKSHNDENISISTTNSINNLPSTANTSELLELPKSKSASRINKLSAPKRSAADVLSIRKHLDERKPLSQSKSANIQKVSRAANNAVPKSLDSKSCNSHLVITSDEPPIKRMKQSINSSSTGILHNLQVPAAVQNSTGTDSKIAKPSNNQCTKLSKSSQSHLTSASNTKEKLKSKHNIPAPKRSGYYAVEGIDQEMIEMLKKHNQKFAPAPVYEPSRHSVRDVRKWESMTGKTWALLKPEEREKANNEISIMKDSKV